MSTSHSRLQIQYLLLASQITGDDPLFVTFSGDLLSVKGLYLTRMYVEVCKLMNVKHLTATENRHTMATAMRPGNATGNMGLAHSESTQEGTYNDCREEEGLKNKLDVHKKPYSKKAILPTGENIEFVNEAFCKIREAATRDIQDKRLSARYKNYKELIECRGKQRNLLSMERSLFIHIIFSVIDCEMTSLFICCEDPPKRDMRWASLFKRFMSSQGEGMEDFRNNCAKVAAHGLASGKYSSQDQSVKFVSKAFSESIYYLNVSRIRKSDPEHVLFKYETLSRRFQRHDQKIAKMIEDQDKESNLN